MTPPRLCLQRGFIPRMSHGYRHLAARSGVWLHRPGTSQGRHSALSWCFVWWQVQGSNLGRLSRRFYRPLPLATRATCQVPPCGQQ
jgi:hypothetical protein